MKRDASLASQVCSRSDVMFQDKTPETQVLTCFLKVFFLVPALLRVPFVVLSSLYFRVLLIITCLVEEDVN